MCQTEDKTKATELIRGSSREKLIQELGLESLQLLQQYRKLYCLL